MISIEREEIIYKICVAEHITKLILHEYFIQRLETTVRSLKYSCKLQTDNGTLSTNQIEEIAKLLEIDIIENEKLIFPSSVDAICYRSDKNGKRKRKIVLKYGLDEDKKRFALAHELGHLVLGHDPIDYNSACDRFKDFREFIKNEFEANHFAGALLIDKKSLVDRIENSLKENGEKLNLESLAEIYKVPYETVAHRLVLIANLLDRESTTEERKYNFHLLKVDETGYVVRKFGDRKGYVIDWIGLEEACLNTAARKVLNEPTGQLSQCSIGDNRDKNQILCCHAQKIEEGGKIFGLAIGTTEDNKKMFSYFDELNYSTLTTICRSPRCGCDS